MRAFYKRDGESEAGEEGIVYLEVTDGWPTRQVEIYGEKWRWGDESHNQYLADQAAEYLDLSDEFAISQHEFELAWTEARKCWPRPL